MSLQLLIRPLISSLQIFARVIYHVVAFPRLDMAVQIPRLVAKRLAVILLISIESNRLLVRGVFRAAVESRFHPLAEVD